MTEEEAQQAGEVFQTHRRFIESVASRHAPSPDHVPDIVQNVGIRLCRGLNGFREEAEITTWLFRVTVNESRNYYIQQRRHERAVEELTLNPMPDDVLDPDEHVLQAERRRAVHEAIDRLPANHRAIMCDEIRPDAVLLHDRRTRHRARKRLRMLLQDDPRLED